METLTESFGKVLVETAAKSPRKGAVVRVCKGRKHLGVVGRVTWHGPDQYARIPTFEPWQRHMLDAQGTAGFRVRIAPEDGEQFFVSAEKVEVIEVAA
jgi:hypothetical protein